MLVFGHLVNPGKLLVFHSAFTYSLVSSNWEKEIGPSYNVAGAEEDKSTIGCYTLGKEGQKSKYEYK